MSQTNAVVKILETSWLPTIYQSVRTVMDDFKTLFHTLPGKTDNADHCILTIGPPVRLPPRHIPEQYQPEVKEQIKSMLRQGIIEENGEWHQLYK